MQAQRMSLSSTCWKEGLSFIATASVNAAPNSHVCCSPGRFVAPSYMGPVWLLHEPVACAPTDGLHMPHTLTTYLDLSLLDKTYVNRCALCQARGCALPAKDLLDCAC